jgi:hypothetical protein
MKRRSIFIARAVVAVAGLWVTGFYWSRAYGFIFDDTIYECSFGDCFTESEMWLYTIVRLAVAMRAMASAVEKARKRSSLVDATEVNCAGSA